MECAIRTIRKINFNMGAIKVEDTKRIRFSNMAKFMFEADGWEAGCWYTIGYTARGAWW